MTDLAWPLVTLALGCLGFALLWRNGTSSAQVTALQGQIEAFKARFDGPVADHERRLLSLEAATRDNAFNVRMLEQRGD